MPSGGSSYIHVKLQGYYWRLAEFFWVGYKTAYNEEDGEVDTHAVLEDLYKKIKEGRQ